MARAARISHLLFLAALGAVGLALLVVVAGSQRAAANHGGRNGVIAFVEHDQSGSIETIPPQGGPMKTLIEGKDIRPPGTGNADVLSPSYSAIGSTLVFVGSWSTPTGPREYHIFRMRENGTVVKQLTDEPTRQDFDPTYAPNTQVVFVRESIEPGGGVAHLFKMRNDGGGIRQLTHGTVNREANPSFDPKGRFIVFESARGIETIRPDGSNRKVIIRNGAGNLNYAPDVAPSGQRIVFVSTRHKGPDLYIARPNGGGIRQLTDHVAKPPSDCFKYHCPESPVFSPDGKRIAFIFDNAYNSILQKVGTSGTPGPRSLDTDPFEPQEPAWRPLG